MSAAVSRPSLGFGDELDDLDAVPAPTRVERPNLADLRRAGEAAGFRSREPARPAAAAPDPEPPKVLRRRRTGRTAQFNLKTKPETIEAFTRVADANGWGLGEAFERATALLEREHATR